jgi:hypothetical protein
LSATQTRLLYFDLVHQPIIILRHIVNRERLKSNLKLAKVEQEKDHFELEKALIFEQVISSLSFKG